MSDAADVRLMKKGRRGGASLAVVDDPVRLAPERFLVQALQILLGNTWR